MKNNNISQHNASFKFVVSKGQVNKKKNLKTSILYDKVALSANLSVNPYKNILITTPKTFDLNFIQNASLNDEIIVENKIQKLNDTELKLCVVVLKKNKDYNDIICKAVFGYHFKSGL